jgi:hypothetical protein
LTARRSIAFRGANRAARARKDIRKVCLHWESLVLTKELQFDYAIRFRGNILVTAANGEAQTAADWVGSNGRARILREAAVMAEGYRGGAVVCVRDKAMKQTWAWRPVLPAPKPEP